MEIIVKINLHSINPSVLKYQQIHRTKQQYHGDYIDISLFIESIIANLSLVY